MKWLVAPLAVIGALLGITVSPCSAQIVEGGGHGWLWRPSFLLANKLTRQVDFDGFSDPKTTLEDELDALTSRFKFTIDLDEIAFRQAGCRDVLRERVAQTPMPRMKDVPLAAVLRAILARVPSSSGATIFLRPDYVEITTHRQAVINADKGVRVLLEDSRERLLYLKLRTKHWLTDEDRFAWTGVWLEGTRIDIVGLARNVGEISYWCRVRNESGWAAIEEAVGAAQTRKAVSPAPN